MFLTDAQKNKYKVMNRSRCENYCKQKHKKTALVISIKSSWDKKDADVFVSNKNNVKYILRLSFDDCDFEDNPEKCMSFAQGKKVADFVNKYYDDIDVIIVHCDGGISRSAGVAAAIMRVKEGSDQPIFDSQTKYPNMTCYLRTLKGFGYI